MQRTLIILLIGICLSSPCDASASHNWLIRRWFVVLEEQRDSNPKHVQDRVSVSNKKGIAILTVRHRRGIGSARLRFNRNPKFQRDWPSIRLRFKNFKGLEGLKVKNGERTISLHDEDSSPRGQHLNAKHKGKGFEVEIPQDFLQTGDSRLQVEWVDFYR